MTDNPKSNLTFVSNLQPVVGDITNDTNFISKIRDPFCLEKMEKNSLYTLTAEQESIFRKASGHCIYAAPGDYPWGSIIDENGVEKVVCKCENKKCSMFEDCRSDLFE